MNERLKRGLWFVGLWVLGVSVVAALGYIVRFFLGQ